MRQVLFAALLLAPTLAVAQPATQPVTLTPQEYEALLSALAQRDPIISGLMQKQAQAQAATQKASTEKPPPAP